jgi:hypothetical protein
MKPDGAGTDERLSPDELRRLKKNSSVENDVMRLAVVFAVVASLILGAYYLSNRATMPDLSEDNPSLQAP